MPDGFKLFTGQFCIKYILMAAFDIHLLILKKLNQMRCVDRRTEIVKFLTIDRTNCIH